MLGVPLFEFVALRPQSVLSISLNIASSLIFFLHLGSHYTYFQACFTWLIYISMLFAVFLSLFSPCFGLSIFWYSWLIFSKPIHWIFKYSIVVILFFKILCSLLLKFTILTFNSFSIDHHYLKMHVWILHYVAGSLVVQFLWPGHGEARHPRLLSISDWWEIPPAKSTKRPFCLGYFKSLRPTLISSNIILRLFLTGLYFQNLLFQFKISSPRTKLKHRAAKRFGLISHSIQWL